MRADARIIAGLEERVFSMSKCSVADWARGPNDGPPGSWQRYGQCGKEPAVHRQFDPGHEGGTGSRQKRNDLGDLRWICDTTKRMHPAPRTEGVAFSR